MLLYKYVPPVRRDILENCTIRYTQASAFNDPFESAALVHSFPEDRTQQDAVDEIYQKKELGMWISPQEVMLTHNYQMQNVIGVLSLTEKPDNLLMWAHYAQSHEGFVIGFDASHDYFKPSSAHYEDDILDIPHKVKYERERPKGSFMELLAGGAAFLVKSPDWEYEQEWRVMRHKEGARQIVDQGVLHPVYLFPFPPDCVQQIIFGWRMFKNERRKIYEIIRGNPGFIHVELYEARPSNDKYQMDIERIENPLSYIGTKEVTKVTKLVNVFEGSILTLETMWRAMGAKIEREKQPDGLWTLIITHLIDDRYAD